MKSATQDMNLTRLEQEPIHLYNRLQPYGILLVLEEPDLRILQVSSNAQELLGIPLENIINQTLESIFDAFQVGYIYVQLLEMRYREKLDQDAEEFINFAVEGVNLMQSLIDGLLAYSKVDLQRNQ